MVSKTQKIGWSQVLVDKEAGEQLVPYETSTTLYPAVNYQEAEKKLIKLFEKVYTEKAWFIRNEKFVVEIYDLSSEEGKTAFRYHRKNISRANSAFSKKEVA